jgi:hypothetical protein
LTTVGANTSQVQQSFPWITQIGGNPIKIVRQNDISSEASGFCFVSMDVPFTNNFVGPYPEEYLDISTGQYVKYLPTDPIAFAVGINVFIKIAPEYRCEKFTLIMTGSKPGDDLVKWNPSPIIIGNHPSTVSINGILGQAVFSNGQSQGHRGQG